MRHLRDIRRGVTDGRTDGRMDGRTDKASDRVACPQLKTRRFPILSFEASNFISGNFLFLNCMTDKSLLGRGGGGGANTSSFYAL